MITFSWDAGAGVDKNLKDEGMGRTIKVIGLICCGFIAGVVLLVAVIAVVVLKFR